MEDSILSLSYVHIYGMYWINIYYMLISVCISQYLQVSPPIGDPPLPYEYVDINDDMYCERGHPLCHPILQAPPTFSLTVLDGLLATLYSLFCTSVFRIALFCDVYKYTCIQQL